MRISSVARDALSVSLAVGFYGVAFGAAGVAAGLSVTQTCAMSLLSFTGASQFAAVGVLAGGGSAASAIGAATLLGTRNTLYGAQMAPLLGVRGWRKLLSAHWTIDESTNVALAQADAGTAAMRRGFWLTGGGVYLFWNLCTLFGALGAGALGNPANFGLDTAVPAAFLALLWPRLRTRRLGLVAAAAAALCLVSSPYLSSGLPIILTTSVAIVAGWSTP